MAGLKAIIEWFPKQRIALVNGAFIALGTAGAVTATAPVDWILGGLLGVGSFSRLPPPQLRWRCSCCCWPRAAEAAVL